MKEALKLILLGLALCIAGSFVLDDFYRSLVIEICIFSLLAQSVNILYGYMGVLSFGQSLFFGLSSSIVALGIHYTTKPLLLWVVLALFSCSLVAVIFGYALSRLEGHNFVIFSVLLSLFPYLLSNTFSNFTGGDDGLSLDFHLTDNFSFNSILNNPLYFYFFTVLIVIVATVLTWTLYKGSFGLISKGIRENQFRMELLGYNLAKHKLYVYIISGLFAGVSGILYVFFSKYLSSSFFHWSLSGEAIVWASFLGRGTFWGPLVGTAILLLLKDELSSYTGIYPIIIGFLLILSISSSKLVAKILSVKYLFFHIVPFKNYMQTSSINIDITIDTIEPTEIDVLASEVFKSNNLTLNFEHNSILNDISVKASLDTGLSIKLINNDIKTLSLMPHSKKKMAIAIVGENGSGKTTFLNVLSGIQKGFYGEVKILEKNISKKTNKYQSFFGDYYTLPIGRTFQRVELFQNLSVRENVLLGLLASQAETDKVIFDKHYCHLKSIGNTFGLNHLFYSQVSELSYGQKKILELALVIAADSKLLLLDEPFNGVGTQEKNILLKILQNLSASHPMVLVEHDRDTTIELTDFIITLENGVFTNVQYSTEL